MIQSMTGFGSATQDDFTVEIRSLNHRYTDITMKLPPYMNQHEIPLRNIIKETFQRGKFDVTVSLNGDKAMHLKVNRELARNIHDALQSLQKEFSLPGTISIETLSGFREILMEDAPHYDTDSLYRAFREAVAKLEAMRIREGSLLSAEFRRRITLLQQMNSLIQSRAPGEIEAWRERFTERLKLIVDTEILDNNRILQEAAIMAEKLDISEELSRIENHLHQFTEILDDGKTIGKKLDFLLQEINREVNTLSYKSGDYSITNLAVEMKTEIEKIREQVQNIQ